MTPPALSLSQLDAETAVLASRTVMWTPYVIHHARELEREIDYLTGQLDTHMNSPTTRTTTPN